MSFADVDECKLGLHDCELGKETCVNTIGGFKCSCGKGWTQEGDKCIGECFFIVGNLFCEEDKFTVLSILVGNLA